MIEVLKRKNIELETRIVEEKKLVEEKVEELRKLGE